MTIYNKRKDKNPEETIINIKNILKSIGITNLNEIVHKRMINSNAIVSYTITLNDDFFFFSNGKSTNKYFALASAYGELIERIQNGYLIEYKAPDSKLVSISELKKNNIFDFFVNNNSKIEFLESICLNYSSYKNQNEKRIDVLPFFYLNSKSIKYLPISLIKFSSHSTGCCAGNTREEALIEGLCEIFERYVNKQTVISPHSYPEIPEKEYFQYNEIMDIIKYVKKLGISIKIKDASWNGKFPVVCVVLNKNNYEYIHFGCHPSLPIAIERALTETFQGVDLSNKNIIKKVFRNTKKPSNNILSAKIDNALYFRYIEPNKHFYSNIPDYEYNIKNWPNYDSINNSELLNIIIEKLSNENIDIFIRDVSFLGFSSYSIYIPKLMNIFEDKVPCSDFKKRYHYLKCNNLLSSTKNFETKYIMEIISLNEFLDFCQYNFHLNKEVSFHNISIYYLIGLILNKNYSSALVLLKSLKTSKKHKYILKIFELILISILSQKKREYIKQELESKFGTFITNIINDLVFNDNSFEKIIQNIKNRTIYNKSRISPYIKKNKLEISEKIMKRYSKNIPKQKNIFN